MTTPQFDFEKSLAGAKTDADFAQLREQVQNEHTTEDARLAYRATELDNFIEARSDELAAMLAAHACDEATARSLAVSIHESRERLQALARARRLAEGARDQNLNRIDDRASASAWKAVADALDQRNEKIRSAEQLMAEAAVLVCEARAAGDTAFAALPISTARRREHSAQLHQLKSHEALLLGFVSRFARLVGAYEISVPCREIHHLGAHRGDLAFLLDEKTRVLAIREQ